jgi:hypothetical protein
MTSYLSIHASIYLKFLKQEEVGVYDEAEDDEDATESKYLRTDECDSYFAKFEKFSNAVRAANQSRDKAKEVLQKWLQRKCSLTDLTRALSLQTNLPFIPNVNVVLFHSQLLQVRRTTSEERSMK